MIKQGLQIVISILKKNFRAQRSGARARNRNRSIQMIAQFCFQTTVKFRPIFRLRLGFRYRPRLLKQTVKSLERCVTSV